MAMETPPPFSNKDTLWLFNIATENDPFSAMM